MTYQLTPKWTHGLQASLRVKQHLQCGFILQTPTLEADDELRNDPKALAIQQAIVTLKIQPGVKLFHCINELEPIYLDSDVRANGEKGVSIYTLNDLPFNYRFALAFDLSVRPQIETEKLLLATLLIQFNDAFGHSRSLKSELMVPVEQEPTSDYEFQREISKIELDVQHTKLLNTQQLLTDAGLI